MHRASIALVGFSSGYIRGYSKSGQVVLSEHLSMDAVTKISFMWPSLNLRKNIHQVRTLTSKRVMKLFCTHIYVHHAWP